MYALFEDPLALYGFNPFKWFHQSAYLVRVHEIHLKFSKSQVHLHPWLIQYHLNEFISVKLYPKVIPLHLDIIETIFRFVRFHTFYISHDE